MPGTSSKIVTDPLHTYPDQALIAKISTDLVNKFQHGWLEHHFEVFLSETVEKLAIDNDKIRKEIAEQLTVDVLVYLTDNELI